MSLGRTKATYTTYRFFCFCYNDGMNTRNEVAYTSVRRSLYVVLLLSALHGLGLGLDLYVILPWWDILVHFVGGAWSAFFAIYILAKYTRIDLFYNVLSIFTECSLLRRTKYRYLLLLNDI